MSLLTDSTPKDPQAVLDTLAVLKTQIPFYTQLTKDETIRLRRAGSLDRDWVIEAIGAAGTEPAIQQILGTTPEALFTDLSDDRRWHVVESELRAVLAGVIAANLIRRHRLGLLALQIYAIARQLIRQPLYMTLIPFVERLKEMNKLGKRKKGAGTKEG